MLTGSLSTRRVWGLVERLMDEPWSRFRAKQLGGDEWRQHLGWGPAEYLLAGEVDAINVLTAVADAHRTGKKPRRPDRIERPPVAGGAGLGDLPVASSLDELPLAAIEAMVNASDRR